VCYSLWYSTHTMLTATGRQHVELIGIINKPLLLHLVGCLYCLCSFISLKKLKFWGMTSSKFNAKFKNLLCLCKNIGHNSLLA